MSRNPRPRPRWRALLLVVPLLLIGCSENPAPVAPTGPGAVPDPLPLVVPVYSYGELALGGLHTCTLRSDQAVTCWGSNENGMLGVPPSTVRLVTNTGPYVDVSSFWAHTCAVQVGGDIECWGSNSQGQVGAPANPTYPYFARAAHPGPFDQVAAGDTHTCGLRTDGSVTCWGSSSWGETTVPASVTNVTQLSAGDDFTCALEASSDLTCWGNNTYGQINDNPSSGPATATRSGPFVEIAASFYHLCALRGDGDIVCWGSNGWGQVGGPATPTYPYYATVTHTGPFVHVATGGSHTCAVRSDGSVSCWGADRDGQSTVPGGLGGVVDLDAGGSHTCARASDNTITCWGYGGNGQLNVPPVSTTRIAPAATFNASPNQVTLGQSFTLQLTGAAVPGHPEATSFTYAFDCGSGYGAFGTVDAATCPASIPGNATVRGRVRDQDGDETEYVGSVSVTYAFAGFFQPVDNLPTLNLAKAGSAIPVKFSLGGNQGLNILAAGYPASQQVSCNAGAPQDAIENTVNAKASSLSYEAKAQAYLYAWKTDKSWSGTCRTLTFTFIDGTTHQAEFKFK